jgi:hypothetical protein
VTRTARGLLIALHLSALFVFLFTIVQYLDKPLRFDETEWVRHAGGILAHGVPMLTLAEDRAIDFPTPDPWGAHYGMWHPPLYEYTLAAGIAAFGGHNWVYRGVSLACLLLSLWLSWAIVRLLMPGSPRLLRALPISLALCIPLVTEGGLFLDIDNTVLLPILLAMLLRFLRTSNIVRPRVVAELALLFALALSAKLTTPFIVGGSFGLYALLRPRPVRGALAVIAIVLGGTGVFALAYWLYCRLLAYPASFMFAVTYLGRRDEYSTLKSAKAILFAVRWNVVWITPVVTWLLASLTWMRLRWIGRNWRAEPIDLLVICSVTMLIVYVGVGAMWGKYTMPAAFTAALAIGVSMAPAWRALTVSRPLACAGAIMVLAIVEVLLPLPRIRAGGYYDLGSAQLWASAIDPRNVSLAATFVLTIALAGAAGRWWIAAGRQGAVAPALVVGLAVIAVVTTTRVAGPNADNGPIRPAFDQGFAATVSYLQRAVPPGAMILVPKDVGYYSGVRYFSLEDTLHNGLAMARGAARLPDVRFIVDSRAYPVIVDPDFYDGIDIARVDAVGDWRVYVKR